jgi:hypothetical protein
MHVDLWGGALSRSSIPDLEEKMATLELSYPPSEEIVLAEDVDVGSFDTSLPGQPILVSRHSRFLQVSGLTKEVLLLLSHGPVPRSELYVRLQEVGEAPYASEQIDKTLRQLEERQIIHAAGDAVSPCPNEQLSGPLNSRYFILKCTLLPAPLVGRMVQFFTWLFPPRLVLVAFPVMLILQFVLWRFLFHDFRPKLIALTGWDYALLLIGNYGGLLLHELGHASACAASRLRPGPIGFGLYLVFPALYTDVTEAWKLPRDRRLVVDAGGMYFNLIAATLTAILYFLTHRPLFFALTGLYDMVVWFSLWPFVRMDGYWMVGDLLGIPNLMSANRDTTLWLMSRSTGGSAPPPQVLRLVSRSLRAVYIVYYVFFAFFTVIMLSLLVYFLPMITRSLAAQSQQIFHQAAVSGLSLSLFSASFRLLGTSVPLLGIGLYLWHFLARATLYLRKVAEAWQSPSQESDESNP